MTNNSDQNNINQTNQSNVTNQTEGTRDLRNLGLNGIEEFFIGGNRLLPSIFELPRRLRRAERRGSSLRQDPSKN